MGSKRIEYTARLLYKYGAGPASLGTAFKLLFGKGGKLRLKLKKYPHPIYVRGKGSDLEVLNDVLLKFCYKFRTRIDFEPKAIIDCGANIGLTSVFFRSMYPDAEIYAVEPEENNYRLMVENLERYDNIHSINTGIWSRDTYLRVDNPDAEAWGFSFHETEDSADGGVKALSIRSIMEQYGIDSIDILKIDIEGAEREVFSEDCEYWLSRTRVLIIELHDRAVEGCSKAFFNALCKYDFSTEIKGDNIFCFIK